MKQLVKHKVYLRLPSFRSIVSQSYVKNSRWYISSPTNFYLKKGRSSCRTMSWKYWNCHVYYITVILFSLHSVDHSLHSYTRTDHFFQFDDLSFLTFLFVFFFALAAFVIVSGFEVKKNYASLEKLLLLIFINAMKWDVKRNKMYLYRIYCPHIHKFHSLSKALTNSSVLCSIYKSRLWRLKWNLCENSSTAVNFGKERRKENDSTFENLWPNITILWPNIRYFDENPSLFTWKHS